jgi:MYXO-CTERM domain-containing protein
MAAQQTRDLAGAVDSTDPQVGLAAVASLRNLVELPRFAGLILVRNDRPISLFLQFKPGHQLLRKEPTSSDAVDSCQLLGVISMSAKHSMIVISAAAFLMSSAATLKAQAPTDTPPANNQTDTRPHRDFDWGWLGLLGLLGLGGLSGKRRREDVVVRR